jgi:hypothetical protein
MSYLLRSPQIVKSSETIDRGKTLPQSPAKADSTSSASDQDLEALWLLELLVRPA